MVSELYQLPDGWEWKTIDDLCEILDRLRKPISQRDRISGEYPYYGASGILDYINDYIFDERLLLIGEDGAKWGADENTAFIADGKYWVNNHAHIMRPNSSLVMDSILVYYLNTTDLNEYITGATVKKLNQQKLKEIKIPLPPLEEQKRIVSKLDRLFEKIDKAISLHQKNIDEANIFMASVLNDIFSELEEKYGLSILGDLTKTTSGGTPKRNEKSYWNGTIGWLKSGELNDGYITKVEELITEDGLKKSSAKIFPKGTLLIAMYGATVGRLGILEIETSTNQAICGILNDKNKFVTKYMFYFLFKIREKMLIDSFGGAQPNISQTYIKELELPLPPLETQQKVVDYLDSVSEKMEKVKTIQKEKMASLKALKASILDKAFRGEL